MIRINSRREFDEGIDMNPVIDIVFILLVFFVLAASYSVRGLDVDLPSAKATSAVAGRVVEIRLAADGSYAVDGVPVSREDLPYAVGSAVRSFKTRPGQIVLFSDPKAPVESLMFLIDHLKRNGGEKLMVASKPSED